MLTAKVWPRSPDVSSVSLPPNMDPKALFTTEANTVAPTNARKDAPRERSVLAFTRWLAITCSLALFTNTGCKRESSSGGMAGIEQKAHENKPEAPKPLAETGKTQPDVVSTQEKALPTPLPKDLPPALRQQWALQRRGMMEQADVRRRAALAEFERSRSNRPR
jgi:hypothetical protein